jgi:DNA polymerase-1
MKVFLIDANSLIYRIYHAMPKLTDPLGRPIQAIYGLSNILLKILKENQFDYIFALYDRPEPTIRHQIFKEYKAARPKATDDLKLQISLSKKIFSAFNIPVIEKIGYEADDLIATLKEKFFNLADEIIILSGDLDTLQLVDDKTKILTMKKGISQTIIYDKYKVKERYGISPFQITDYKALVGDASDNIKGISGIGPKTASQLLEKYNNLEGIIEAAKNKKLDFKLAKQILNNSEKLLFNKDLITLRKNVEIDEKILLPYQNYKKENLIEVFKEFGFKSLIQRLSLENKDNLLKTKSIFDNTIFTTQNKINNNVSLEIKNLDYPLFFCLNNEKIEVYDKNQEKKYFDKKLIKDLLITEQNIFVFDLKNILKEILKDDFYFDKKINLKNIYDLKIIFWLINPDKGHYNLDQILSFFSVSDPLKITQNLINKLKELNLEKIYFEFELPLIPILARMELRGINIDLKALEEFKNKIKEKQIKLLEEIYNLANQKFNPNSPSQLREILFKKLKLSTKGLSKTVKGEISTQESELLKIVNLHPIVKKILDYRQLTKLLNTYIDSLFKNYDPQTKKIYTIFNQTGSTTGRIISQNPNLQNLPISGELARYLRKCFIPEEGYIFLKADYSQIELRLLAHLSKDENLISVFKNDLDLHSQTAKIIFGIETQETRRKAKIINFGITYGISAKSLSQKLNISVSEASKLIDKFFYFYPKVKKLKEDIIEFAKIYGFVETLFGRKRFIPEINYQSYKERKSAERIAFNMPIQGLASDIFKKTMIALDDLIYQKKLPVYLILTIHDEIIFEVKNDIKTEFQVIIKELMENIVQLEIPLKVQIKEGKDLSFE